MEKENEENTNFEKSSKNNENFEYSRNDTMSAIDFKIVEEFATRDEKSIASFISENMDDKNYYIFIYCAMKKFYNNFLTIIKRDIIPKVSEETFDFGEMTEDVFEENYKHIVLLNALSQSMNILYKDFLRVCMENEKKIPVPIIIRLIDNEDLDLIQEIVEKKISIYDIENCSFLEKQNYYPEIFFLKIKDVTDNIKIRLKNNYLTPKKIIYYIYKTENLSETKRENLIKDVISMFRLNKSDILISVIKMKDQDLAEELIVSSDLVFEDENLLLSLISSIKYNQPRISFLLYKYSKSHLNILYNKKVHRSLIRSLIEFPENIEIFLYIIKRTIEFFSISDTVYLLSILNQLESSVSEDDCKFYRIINPFKIFVLVLELINMIKLRAYQVKTKCDEIFSSYMKLSTTYIEEHTDNFTLESVFKDKDLENREVVYIIAENNFIYLLKNPVVENIVMKIWNSNYSSHNNYYDTSTFFSITKANNVEDIKLSIKKINQRKAHEYKTLTGSFLVWKDSIKVKYYNKILIFIILLLFFQLLNSQLVTTIAPLIDTGIDLRATTSIWLPAFNSYYKTNFTLSYIQYNIVNKNMTFIGAYIMNISGGLKENLTKINQDLTSLQTQQIYLQNITIIINYSTYIYLYAIINILFRFLYHSKTNNKIVRIDTQSLLDIIIFIVLVYRIVQTDQKFIEIFDFSKIDQYDDRIRKNWVNIMSTFFVCLWFKLIVFLKFSSNVGPLLRILQMICKKLLYFGIIILSETFIFSCIGNLLFSTDHKTDNYKSLNSSFITVFSAMMNSFDFNSFSSDNIALGSGFLIIHIIISTIILLNFLIAILSNVYEKFQESSILLFHQEILLKKAELLPDDYYGALILIPFPLNIINIFSLPFYLCCSSKRKLKIINKYGLYIAYSTLYIFLVIIHSLSQIAFFVLTLFKLLYHTIYELFNKTRLIGQKKHNFKDRLKNSIFCFVLFLMAPFLFFYCFIYDLIIYSKCLFREDEIEKFYFEEQELVSRFILQKCSTIFDKSNNYFLYCNEVIKEFVDILKQCNEKYDFRNVLFNINKEHSFQLIREYTLFVKFIHKLKLKNNEGESLIYKSIFSKLLESNINYCRVQSTIKKISKNNSSQKSIIYPEGYENRRKMAFKASQYLPQAGDSDESEEDDVYAYLKMQSLDSISEIDRKNMNLTSSLPKLFYKRLFIVNLDVLKNTMNVVKNQDNKTTTQKIRSDVKLIKKQIDNICIAINAKELAEKQKKIRMSIRRTNSFKNFFTGINNSNIKKSSIKNFSKDSDYLPSKEGIDLAKQKNKKLTDILGIKNEIDEVDMEYTENEEYHIKKD